jgi:UPF0042 nucleotide-binding protein
MDNLVIITGLSGSGKSLAANCLEDLGFFCVDNLPISLIRPFCDLARRSADPARRSALVVDIREGATIRKLPDTLQALRGMNIPLQVLFFECSDEVLKRRFSETRRPHPMANSSKTLEDAIVLERMEMATIREYADRIIDTERFNAHQLKTYLRNAFGGGADSRSLNINVLSFGFKYGIPAEADLVLDVRFIPNPYFVDGLRNLTGKDPEVEEYLLRQPETDAFASRLKEFLGFLVPLYTKEGKTYLTVAIGCTGGKHRSVYLAGELGRHLENEGLAATVNHRDLGRE